MFAKLQGQIKFDRLFRKIFFLTRSQQNQFHLRRYMQSIEEVTTIHQASFCYTTLYYRLRKGNILHHQESSSPSRRIAKKQYARKAINLPMATSLCSFNCIHNVLSLTRGYDTKRAQFVHHQRGKSNGDASLCLALLETLRRQWQAL